MRTFARGELHLCAVLLFAIAFAGPSYAAYEYTSIDYPGADNTQLLGTNNKGLIVGTA